MATDPNVTVAGPNELPRLALADTRSCGHSGLLLPVSKETNRQPLISLAATLEDVTTNLVKIASQAETSCDLWQKERCLENDIQLLVVGGGTFGQVFLGVDNMPSFSSSQAEARPGIDYVCSSQNSPFEGGALTQILGSAGVEEDLIAPLLHLICEREDQESTGPLELEELLEPSSPLKLPSSAALARKLKPKVVADPLLDAAGKPFCAETLFRCALFLVGPNTPTQRLCMLCRCAILVPISARDRLCVTFLTWREALTETLAERTMPRTA